MKNEKGQEQPPIKENQSGVNLNQKPKFDRGDSSQNPDVAGHKVGDEDVADYPHNEGAVNQKLKEGEPRTNEKGEQLHPGTNLTETEWNELPEQSAKRIGGK